MDTQDILFQYLKDIIYNTENASLDLNELPPEFQKLGQGMQLLGKWVKEAKVLSFALARGIYPAAVWIRRIYLPRP